MKLWQGAACVLGGAALAGAVIYTVPGLAPGGSAGAPDEAAASEEQPFGGGRSGQGSRKTRRHSRRTA